MKISLEKLYEFYQQYPEISTDSRQDLNNKIFFAIRGENFDGNKFVLQALEKGAVLAVSEDQSMINHPKVAVVDDSVKWLQQLAAYHRQQLSIPFIAITGSNGKTTTKELVSRVLQKKYRIFATKGNLNNHIGLPLSILSVTPQHEIAVIEIGANHLGETRQLTEITRPTIGILTNIGKDHLGEFGGIEKVVEAYAEFVDYFNQNTQYQLFTNGDDKQVVRLITRAKVSYFGSGNFPFSGYPLSNHPFLQAEINYEQKKCQVKTRLFGSFNIYNILAASAIARHFSIPLHDFTEAIESYSPENLRSQILSWKGNTVILDAYNANPSSMELAISDFTALPEAKKMLILGDMHELGEYSEQEHRKVINMLRTISYDQLILVGKEFGKFKQEIDCLHFENVNELKKWFDNQLFKDYFILIKGSRGQQLEKILNLCNH